MINFSEYPFLDELMDVNDPIIVVDGGSRNGPKDLIGISKKCQFHCFEPNTEELVSTNLATSIDIKYGSDIHVTTYPFALTAETGSTKLNISMRPGGTSTLEPNRELLERFHLDNFSELKEVVKRVTVPAIKLIDFMRRAGKSHIDFIKLDTQGNELDILKSAGDKINSISVIMTEVEFIPIYKDQALFHDVSAFLFSKGFELVDIQSTPTSRRFHARPDLPPSAYRLVWGDAIFALKPADANKPRAIQQGLVLAGLGYADIAIDLFDRNLNLDASQKRQLEIFARLAAEPQHNLGKVKRVFERMFSLIVHRYNWRRGHQVRSLKPT